MQIGNSPISCNTSKTFFLRSYSSVIKDVVGFLFGCFVFKYCVTLESSIKLWWQRFSLHNKMEYSFLLWWILAVLVPMVNPWCVFFWSFSDLDKEEWSEKNDEGLSLEESSQKSLFNKIQMKTQIERQ